MQYHLCTLLGSLLYMLLVVYDLSHTYLCTSSHPEISKRATRAGPPQAYRLWFFLLFCCFLQALTTHRCHSFPFSLLLLCARVCMRGWVCVGVGVCVRARESGAVLSIKSVVL